MNQKGGLVYSLPGNFFWQNTDDLVVTQDISDTDIEFCDNQVNLGAPEKYIPKT